MVIQRGEGDARTNLLCYPYPMTQQKNIAIVGAAGMVGQELLSILQERKFPAASLSLFGSKRSFGQELKWKDQHIPIQTLLKTSFDGVDIAFFAAGGDVSKKWIPIARNAGSICIDKSSLFRLHPEVPLLVPEVNLNKIVDGIQTRLIANPNCTTTPLVQVLDILKSLTPLRRVIVSSYQAVSGSGKKGLDALRTGSDEVYGLSILNNLIPHIQDEEDKIVNETRKILNLPNLAITATCVRVPIKNCHGLSVNVACCSSIDLNAFKNQLSQLPHISLSDYPNPLEATGKNETFVGRIRVDASVKNGISLFIVSDNLRTGAALNSVKIAEQICEVAP